MTASPLPPDPYAALNVTKDATLDQIRSAHRKLVLKAHPDRFPNASPEEKQKKADEFHKIQQAYELLSDNAERQRYDTGVKLAETRAEVAREREAFKERRSTRSQPSSQDYTSQGPFYTYHESRGSFDFEVRMPRSAQKKYEDDYLHTHYDSAGRHDEPYRSSPRTTNQEFKSGTQRRTSGRDYYEDARQAEEDERRLREKQMAKAAKKEKMKAHEAGQKMRDKSKRQGTEAKMYTHSPRPNTFNSDSESDRDDDAGSVRYTRRRSEAQPKRRPEAARKSTRSNRPREVEITDSDESRSHHNYKTHTSSRQREAEAYIESTKGPKNVSDPDSEGRSRQRRSAEKPPEAPTPPSVKDKSEATKRGSKKTRDVSIEARSRREKLHIVDPPDQQQPQASRRSGFDSTRSRPSFRPTESAPPGSSEFHLNMHKASTFQVPIRERDDPEPPRRTKTFNVEPTQSRGRDRERERDRDRDRTPPPRRSDFSSPVVDDGNGFVQDSPATRSMRYRIDEDADPSASPRVVTMEPGSASRRPRAERMSSRDVSPNVVTGSRRTGTPRSARPPAGLGISRAATFDPIFRGTEPSSPRGPPQRASTLRAGSIGSEAKFFEEFRDRDPPRPSAPTRTGSNMSPFPMENVAFSPRIKKQDIQYGEIRPVRRERGDSDKEGKYRDRSPKDNSSSRRDKKSSTRHGDAYLSEGPIPRSQLRQGVRA